MKIVVMGGSGVIGTKACEESDRDFLLPLEGTEWWARGPTRLPGGISPSLGSSWGARADAHCRRPQDLAPAHARGRAAFTYAGRRSPTVKRDFAFWQSLAKTTRLSQTAPVEPSC
jgi:hypothetical protein